MRQFLFGTFVGIALMAVVWMLWPAAPRVAPEAEPAPEARAGGASPAPAPTMSAPPRSEAPTMPAPPRSEAPVPAPALVGSAQAVQRFEPGVAVLKIGDRYVFGEDRVRSGGDGDVVCLDIRRFATLQFARGAARVILPVLISRTRPTASEAFPLAVDAPAALTPSTQRLSPRRSAGESTFGLVFVKSSEGTVYKLAVVAVSTETDALRRTATIRFAPVPSHVGGGVLRIPGAVPGRVLSVEDTARIVERMKTPEGLPDRGGDVAPRVVSIQSPSEDLAFGLPAQFVVEGDLHTKIEGTGLGVFIRGNVAEDAAIKATSGLILVEGDLNGTVRVPGMGRVRILGDLNGRLQLDGQNVAVIDGDVRGILVASGINHIYIKGRLLDPATNFRLQGVSTFYIRSHLSRDELTSARDVRGLQTLQLFDTDIEPAKRPQRIPPWQNVYVRSALWEHLR